MKRFATTALTTGVPFGLFMGMYFAYQNGSRDAVVMGIAAGVLFGLAMAFFQTRVAKRFDAVREQYKPEGLVHDSAANLSIGGLNKAGGWLFLTKRRLVFEPHKVNFGAKRSEILLGELASTATPRGIFASRLEVTTRRGETFRFIVRERELWMAMLASTSKQFVASSTDASTGP